MNRAASSGSSLTSVQVDLLHGGWMLWVAAATAVAGYVLFLVVSVLLAWARRVASGRAFHSSLDGERSPGQRLP